MKKTMEKESSGTLFTWVSTVNEKSFITYN